MQHFFEDLYPGIEFRTPGITVTEEAIIRFGLEWDFQSFHVDKIAAKSSIFGQLVGSGMLTVLVTFRLCVQADIFSGNAVAGLGFDSVRFPQPVYPGSTLQSIVAMQDKRLSRSRPGFGIVQWQIKTSDQDQRVVCSMMLTNLIRCRLPEL